MAGGVALNGRANWKVMESGVFERVFIQPAAGDAGGALGAALSVEWLLGKKKRDPMKNVYLGAEYSTAEIPNSKFQIPNSNDNIKSRTFKTDAALFKAVVKLLVDGKVVGWFQGRFEWGPRALGNRSILADPRNPKMKEIVNTVIKFREPFRPFAPSVLAEYAAEYFDISPIEKFAGSETTPTDFMLYVVNVKKEKRKSIPAVTHVDGTSRPQLVRKGTNLLFWGLIYTFYKKTGIPMLLNTSFNLASEPIVSSPEDAVKTFFSSGLNVLVLGNTVVHKRTDMS
jgi:carbamoyltransferase